MIIALPDDLVKYEPEYVLEQFTKHFRYRYGYEKMLFTIKDKRFKQESFLDEVKRDYTAFINTFVFDEKKKLAVFDKHSPYLATKKIEKNNPKEEQIKTDNWARTEWNRTVDRALVEGIRREEILQVKRGEITEKVQESIHKRGNRPCFFYSIVTHAIDALAALIEKIRYGRISMA